MAPKAQALASLKRCKPGRSPIYRDGDLYELDPHDDEADLWAFRLGLRPPKVAPIRIVRPEPDPLPSVDAPLARAHLDEAWGEYLGYEWSALRVALCILDVHGQAMPGEEVVAFFSDNYGRSLLSADSAKYWNRGAGIRVREDGLWEIVSAHESLLSARQAVINKIERARRSPHERTDPVVNRARQKQVERKRKEHALQLARMRRVLVHAFPAKKPQAIVLLDVLEHKITTFVGEEIPSAIKALADYEIIAAVDVRALLRTLSFEHGSRRIAELGPPQKSKKLNRRGRILKITLPLLIQGSCGISRPFGDEKKLQEYLRDDKLTKLRRRLEADIKSLYALYQYGRLHGALRLRWGFLDERVPVPWADWDELRLWNLKEEASERNLPLEVVQGSAPGWEDPWSRKELAWVVEDENGWRSNLVDERGYLIDEADIQAARLAQ